MNKDQAIAEAIKILDNIKGGANTKDVFFEIGRAIGTLKFYAIMPEPKS